LGTKRADSSDIPSDKSRRLRAIGFTSVWWCRVLSWAALDRAGAGWIDWRVLSARYCRPHVSAGAHPYQLVWNLVRRYWEGTGGWYDQFRAHLPR